MQTSFQYDLLQSSGPILVNLFSLGFLRELQSVKIKRSSHETKFSLPLFRFLKPGEILQDYVNNPVSEQYPIFLSDCISAPKPRGRMLCKHQFRQFNNIFLTGKPFNNNQKKRCHLGVYLLMNGHKEKELHFVLLMNNSYQNSQVSML